jgi:hypothetical protein
MVRTTAAEDASFVAAGVDPLMLESAIDWIASNLDPYDVFDEDALAEWAEPNGYTKGDSDD